MVWTPSVGDDEIGKRAHGVSHPIQQARRDDRRFARRSVGSEADQQPFRPAELARRHRHRRLVEVRETRAHFAPAGSPACRPRRRPSGRGPRLRGRPDPGPSDAASSIDIRKRRRPGGTSKTTRAGAVAGSSTAAGPVGRTGPSKRTRAVGRPRPELELRHSPAHAIAGHVRRRLPDERHPRLAVLAARDAEPRPDQRTGMRRRLWRHDDLRFRGLR